jgi:hypothetical protein
MRVAGRDVGTPKDDLDCATDCDTEAQNSCNFDCEVKVKHVKDFGIDDAEAPTATATLVHMQVVDVGKAARAASAARIPVMTTGTVTTPQTKRATTGAVVMDTLRCQ